ncbi:MAG: TM2 domain-containing protein [Bacteroidota bacterium]
MRLRGFFMIVLGIGWMSAGLGLSPARNISQRVASAPQSLFPPPDIQAPIVPDTTAFSRPLSSPSLTPQAAASAPQEALSPDRLAPLKKHRRFLRRHRTHRPKNQKTALVLAIFLGVLGIHRFYLRFTGIGLIQLLTLGGLLIWFIVDAIRIGLGKLEPEGQEYSTLIGKQGEMKGETAK